MTNTDSEPVKTFLNFPGKIHLIYNNEQLESVEPQLKQAAVLGFDTETKPSFKKGQVFKVALLQLATDEDAFLIRLHKVTQFEFLKEIFESSKIVKTGVAIQDDIKTLKKLFKFEPQKFVELQNLARKKGLKKLGLKNMSEELLKGSVNKGPKMTNWEAQELTDKQLLYAATDAWIGLKLYEKLADPS